MTDCKYGFRGTSENGRATLLSTLINSATSPDPYPERGIHEITLTLGLLPACPAEREYAAVKANRPMVPVSTGSHKGTLPPEGTLLKASCPTGVLSALTADGNTLTARFYSVSGEAGEMTLDVGTLPGWAILGAAVTDLTGRKVGECEIKGTAASAPLAPYALGQITAELA